MRRPSQSGKVRIIGGAWRRRTLTFEQALGVRPTPDRVRETVFNWLAPVLPGARCLDAFAGSGALGFEAASRGARAVDMLDVRPAVVERLREEAARLGGDAIHVACADALGWLARDGREREPYDVVFLDPPYDLDVLGRCAALLEANRWLAPGALVYLEAGPRRPPPSLPEGWTLAREKQAGRVRYYLASRA
jgi:16S rRNA (guanine966-N2)-methyltransferase